MCRQLLIFYVVQGAETFKISIYGKPAQIRQSRAVGAEETWNVIFELDGTTRDRRFWHCAQSVCDTL
jgi:hypothetical protein